MNGGRLSSRNPSPKAPSVFEAAAVPNGLVFQDGGERNSRSPSPRGLTAVSSRVRSLIASLSKLAEGSELESHALTSALRLANERSP